ncbi:cysteine desulfurase [Nitrosomonas eutropha]|uniref:cysteine desulfurase n=1 Tax=Nitrosomonas TaxID=914 RepID=UPI0008891846|nr:MULTISPECIES: cysteine desulfurase [Nitrosomonas]MXS79968.1 cysteine desulfurase [Nitrosomonas sp. GH22]SCX27423.1 cysteine desulfurase [Nitrosomonas eutropha]SDW01043.1 cysteine desulfurase [Nitrosomonas eutropha]
MKIVDTLVTSSAPQTTVPGIGKFRADFPILDIKVDDKPLIYLDNAASSQMPQAVIDCLVRYQKTQHANIHRAVHYLSNLATQEYEAARYKLQNFIGAREDREVIFTSGTTDSINLVMHGYGRKFIQRGDEIILSELEHHSNIVPWQMLAEERGAHIRVAPINDAGELLVEEYEKLFNSKTRFVALSHVSNALGSINPIKRMIAIAHQHDVPVLIDGAQAAPHLKIDVQDLDCDFYAFSAHKMCGPTGIGILYGKAHLLESMQPFKGGGDMIASVSFEKTTYNEIPYKFEAGTPPIAAAIGFGAAIDYLEQIGLDAIADYEHELLLYASEQIRMIPDVKIIGDCPNKVAVISFVIDGIHPHDVGTLLNQEGIAVRTGHHCAQPIMQRFNVAATSRASFSFYNTKKEIDALVAGIRSVQKVFAQ